MATVVDDVRYCGKSGLSADVEFLSEFDPTQTCRSACIASFNPTLPLKGKHATVAHLTSPTAARDNTHWTRIFNFNKMRANTHSNFKLNFQFSF